MDILEVNEYLNAASDALQDDPEYFHWIQALGNARKQALDECDCYTDKVEGCLWQVYARQVKYILENKAKIEEHIRNGNIPDDIEDVLDEADDYAETHSERLSHEEVFSQARVTFRQIVEKTIAVEGSDMATIYKNIEVLKDNPDEIDFDKDCDSVVIEAKVNM